MILGVKSVDSDVENVSYMSLSKPVWALAVLWIIVTCYYGYGGNQHLFSKWLVFKVYFIIKLVSNYRF